MDNNFKKDVQSCYYNEAKIINVTVKELEEKAATILWVQCPKCGANDIKLVPEYLHVYISSKLSPAFCMNCGNNSSMKVNLS